MGRHYLSVLGLKLIHVSKRGPGWIRLHDSIYFAGDGVREATQWFPSRRGGGHRRHHPSRPWRFVNRSPDLWPEAPHTWWRHGWARLSALLAIWGSLIRLTKGQQRRAFMISMLAAWTSCWASCRVVVDLRCHDAHRRPNASYRHRHIL